MYFEHDYIQLRSNLPNQRIKIRRSANCVMALFFFKSLTPISSGV